MPLRHPTPSALPHRRRLAPSRLTLSLVVFAASLMPVASSHGSPQAAVSAAVVPLSDEDRAMLEKGLGRGTIGRAVPAPGVDEPARYLAPVQGTGAFRILRGDDEPTNERLQIARVSRSPEGETWQYDFSKEETNLLRIQPDGSIVLAGTRNSADGALVDYSPPGPFLIRGLTPGQESSVKTAIRVYDLDRPSDLRHEGALSITTRYLGAYRVTVPAGVFEAILTRSKTIGKVGPAQVDNTEYRFFAPGIGLVASFEHREVSAFVVYRTRTDFTKLLAVKPDGTATRAVSAGSDQDRLRSAPPANSR